MNYLFVGMGGVIGALSRFYLGTVLQQASGSLFPYGTLSVNLLGSFLLSFIAYGSLFKWQLPRTYILAINTGCIGSFTTFSTFSVETINLLENARYLAALGYISISVACGLALSWLGVLLAHKLFQTEAGRLEEAN